MSVSSSSTHSRDSDSPVPDGSVPSETEKRSPLSDHSDHDQGCKVHSHDQCGDTANTTDVKYCQAVRPLLSSSYSCQSDQPHQKDNGINIDIDNGDQYDDSNAIASHIASSFLISNSAVPVLAPVLVDFTSAASPSSPAAPDMNRNLRVASASHLNGMTSASSNGNTSTTSTTTSMPSHPTKLMPTVVAHQHTHAHTHSHNGTDALSHTHTHPHAHAHAHSHSHSHSHSLHLPHSHSDPAGKAAAATRGSSGSAVVGAAAVATGSGSGSLVLGASSPSATAHHALKTGMWITVALLISLFIGAVRGRETAMQFVTAYLVEYSLSVDNLFVFLLIFRYFRVPRDAQETVLSYGIVGAMVLRGLMIVAGKSLVNRFEWVGLLFAALLIYSAGKLLFENDDDDDADLDNNRVVRFAKSIFPVADRYNGDRFFTRGGDNSRLLATPLMVVLVSIELSDVVFAVDSVPAVLGLSKDTFVIYTSNIMAVMGLRSLFFVLSSSIGNLRFLKQALAVILGFIGIKMIAGCFGHDFSTAVSLLFVVGSLVIGVLISLVFPSPAMPRSPIPDVNSSSGANIV